MDLGAMEVALTAKFAELGIATETLEHAAAPTVDEHSTHLQHLTNCGQAKNLCVRDKKGNMYLLVALKDTPTDMKLISERLGVPKSAPVRMAPPEKMAEALSVAPGSVTPFGIMSAGATAVRLLLDVKFKACERLIFHPFTNTKSVLIAPADFDKFLLSIGRTPEYVDFSADSSLAKAPEGNGATGAAAASPQTEPKKPKEPKQKKEQAKEAKAKTEVAAPCTPPPVCASKGPAKVAAAPAPVGRELSSDDWASGKYGRAAGKLVVKQWSHTIYTMPQGWDNAPDWLNQLSGRAAGDLTRVDWSNSIFTKPVGWA